jgi:hypothetical protein
MSCVLPYAYINAKYKQVCGGSGFIPAPQVKSSQGTNSRPPEWQLRKLRVPLESPGDVGGNALGTVPPLPCKVRTRRPTLGLPPSGDKDDDTPGPPPPRYQGRDGRGVWSSGDAPTLSQPERDWAVPGWPANRHTVGSGKARDTC